MAREKRSDMLAEQVPNLPSFKKVTAKIVTVITAALPLRENFVASRDAYNTFKGKTLDGAIAQASAMCAQDILEYVLPKASPGSKPEAVFKDAHATQWSLASGEIVTHLLGGPRAARRASDDAKTAAQKRVDSLKQSWSRAQNVMWYNHERPKVLAAFASGRSKTSLSEAYDTYRASLPAKAPSVKRLQQIAAILNRLPVQAMQAVAGMISTARVTVEEPRIAKGQTEPVRRGRRRQVA